MRVPTGPTVPSLCVVCPPPPLHGDPRPGTAGGSRQRRGGLKRVRCFLVRLCQGLAAACTFPVSLPQFPPGWGHRHPQPGPALGSCCWGVRVGVKPPPCATGERAAPKIAPGVRAQPTPSCSAHPTGAPPGGFRPAPPWQGLGGPHTPPCMGGLGHRAFFGVFSRQTVLCAVAGWCSRQWHQPWVGGGSMGGWSLGAHATGCWVGFGS